MLWKFKIRWQAILVLVVVLIISAAVVAAEFAGKGMCKADDDLSEEPLLINGKTAEETILLFAKEKGITAEKGTKQYLQFMRDILLGEYPELTGLGSKYFSNQKELDLILAYVTEQRSPMFKDFPIEAEINEAVPGNSNLFQEGW